MTETITLQLTRAEAEALHALVDNSAERLFGDRNEARNTRWNNGAWKRRREPATSCARQCSAKNIVLVRRGASTFSN